jgi:NADH dehydrogenase (ubiquinone) flavoprotein 2
LGLRIIPCTFPYCFEYLQVFFMARNLVSLFRLYNETSSILLASKGARRFSNVLAGKTFGSVPLANKGSVKSFSTGSLSHVDREGNTASTTFDFTDENYEKIENILKKYPRNYKSSAVIALLDLAQRQCGGWIPLAAMNQVAKILEMPPIRVYEIVTFYSMFYREPIGKFNVQVCCTTPCMIRGAYDILRAIQDKFNLEPGGNSPDMMFHLEEVECLGACVNAPMMQVNDDYYEDLTVESAIRVLENLRDNKPVKVGPQNGRHQCVGIQGKTTLLSEPPGPYCRSLETEETKKTS